MFLPWRTTALTLAGADSIGSVQLLHGCSNQVFSRGDQLTMLVWNETPCEEQISLGEDVQQTDVWGNTTQPKLDAKRQCCLTVGGLPIFLTSLNTPLVHWQLATSLAHRQWPNELGVPLENAVAITNSFPQNITGTLRLVTPQRWRVIPRDTTFKLAPGETA